MSDDRKSAIIRSYSAIALGSRRSCGCDGGSEDSASEPSAAVSGAGPREIDLGCGSPLEEAGLAPGQTVLDLGSGSGREVFAAARMVGPSGRAIGLDMTPAMIDLARANAAALGSPNASFVLGEIGAMPLEDGSVDRVVSNCVINLTPDKRRAFAEIHRVLKPGGRFAVSDIVASRPLPEVVRNDDELWCGCVAGALEERDYLDAIDAAGFTGVTVTSRRADSSSCGADFGLVSITVTGGK